MGNSEGVFFKTVNMPVDFDAGKVRYYVLNALRIGGENAWNARSIKLLGDLMLLKNNVISDICRFDGFSVKTDSFDQALLNYREAARRGDPKALLRLFAIYNNGIPIGYGKYLVEADRSFAFACAKESVEIECNFLLGIVARSFYDDESPYRNMSLAKKYIKLFVDLRLGGDYGLWEVAATLAESGQLEGYSTEDAKKIRESIPRRFKDDILYLYDSGKLRSESGERYWREMKSENAVEPLHAEFIDYLGSLPQTQENRFLKALISFDKMGAMSFYGEGKDECVEEFISLADEGYVEAIKWLSSYIEIIPAKFSKPSRYREMAKKLKLPIIVRCDSDLDYNIALYNQTKDDAVLSKIVGNDPKVLEFLSKNSKNNYNAADWAALRLLRADSEKSPREFDEVLDFIKKCSRDPMLSIQSYVLLAYAHSGNRGMRNDPKLYREYINAAKEKRDLIMYARRFLLKGEEYQDAQRKLNFLLMIVTNTTDPFFSCVVKNISIEDLRLAHKENPESVFLKSALAENEKESGNYAEAFKLFSELNESFPNDLRYSAQLAEMYYYGLGVKEDKAMGLKHYQRLFSALKERGYECTALYIIANSFGVVKYPEYCKVKIPKEVVIENIKDISPERFKGISRGLLAFLEINGEVALRDKFEKFL